MFIHFKHLLFKSYFIAIVISIVVIGFLPNMFNKYEINVIESGNFDNLENLMISSHDLNNDGFSEIIYSYDVLGNNSLQVFTHDGGMIDQWNPPGSIITKFGNKRLVYGDFDEDGFCEIYTFYGRNDTIFLYCFEPMDTINPITFKDKTVCFLNRKYNEPDPDFKNILFKDINADGKGDLVFVIKSGQARIPRNVFVYDMAKDTILKSPDYGATFDYFSEFIDFEGDGDLEIIGSMRATGNITNSLGYEYSDYSAWLMVYNNNLRLKFDPIEFPGFISNLEVHPVLIDNNPLLVCFYNHRGSKDNFPKLFFVDAKGIIIKEYIFPKSQKNRRSLLVTNHAGDLHFNIIDSEGYIMVFNKKFKLIRDYNLKMNIYPHPILMDLDRNGTLEIIFATKEKSILITDQDFNNPIHYKYKFPLSLSLSTYVVKDNISFLLFYDDKEYINLQYAKNPLASLRFLIYLGIYLSIWLFIVAIQKLQLIQIQKKERIRNQIVNLQLKSFKNQMDPHFTFNVFNTMAYKIQKESPESYEAFMEFSNLIRKILLSSDSITRSIEDEISQLKSYLELEKLRFPDKVFYNIEIEKEINQEMHIPKMILQTYVENAIKHGIKHKMDSGTVKVNIKKEVNNILFEITDDGIGREKAKELATEGTGFGLKIMDNYFRLFNEYNVSKIKHEIIDLYDKDNKAAGTKVRILIPLNFSYKFKKHDKR